MNNIQFFNDKICQGTCDPLDIGHMPVGADLFELQMFLLDIGNGQNAWYGSLRNLNDGKKLYFKGWSGLTANLEEILTPIARLEVLSVLLLSQRRLEDKII